MNTHSEDAAGRSAGIDEAALAQWLLDNPDFFLRHADVLSRVRLPDEAATGGTGRVLSLHEHQTARLREQVRALEMQLAEAMHHSETNLRIAQKLHTWICVIARQRKLRTLPWALKTSLQRCFDIPQVALRLWGLDAEYVELELAGGGISLDARAFAESLPLPFCGPCVGVEPATWLGHPDQARSMALLSLRDIPPRRSEREREAAGQATVPQGNGEVFGMLVLASDDPQRFSPDMGTDFLQYIAAIAGAMLSRLR